VRSEHSPDRELAEVPRKTTLLQQPSTAAAPPPKRAKVQGEAVTSTRIDIETRPASSSTSTSAPHKTPVLESLRKPIIDRLRMVETTTNSELSDVVCSLCTSSFALAESSHKLETIMAESLDSVKQLEQVRIKHTLTI